MKVLLIGNYFYDRQQSMQRFGALLQRLLGEAGQEARLLQPPPVLGRLKPSENGIGKWFGYVDRFILFRPLLLKAASWADVVHICDHSSAMYVPWLNGKPHVVTCHDMLAIRSALHQISEQRTRWSGRVQQRWILRGLRQAQRVVCVSKQTAREVLQVTSLPEERVTVVPNALNYPYCPIERPKAAARLARLGLDATRPFLLHVGGNQWYKNRLGVLRIFRHLMDLSDFKAYRLVMAGKPMTGEMRSCITRSGLADRIHELTNLSNDDLQALYCLAQALVFPSLYEGFGWPIIEAQACGCPVVTSNRPPMTEVGGDAAIYMDPSDEAAAANAIAQKLPHREALRDAGFLNCVRFSTVSMIAGYQKEYKTVVAISNHRLITMPGTN